MRSINKGDLECSKLSAKTREGAPGSTVILSRTSDTHFLTNI